MLGFIRAWRTRKFISKVRECQSRYHAAFCDYEDLQVMYWIKCRTNDQLNLRPSSGKRLIDERLQYPETIPDPGPTGQTQEEDDRNALAHCQRFLDRITDTIRYLQVELARIQADNARLAAKRGQ